MQNHPIDLSYNRLNQELSLHWSRMNLIWLVVTLSYSALGYMLYSYTGEGEDSATRYTLLVLSSAATVVASLAWRSMWRGGVNMIDLLEQKVGQLELAAKTPVYLSTDKLYSTPEQITAHYREPRGLRVHPHQSVNVTMGILTFLAAASALGLHVLIVYVPSQLGVSCEQTPLVYVISWATLVAVFVFVMPYSLDFTLRRRVLAEGTVQQLQMTIEYLSRKDEPASQRPVEGAGPE